MQDCCQCLNITTSCCCICVACTESQCMSDTGSETSNWRQRCVYQCLFFSLGVTLFVLSLLSYLKFSSSLTNYELILENWQTDPIVSIRVSDQCNPDEKNLIHYGWPGTIGACDCRNYNAWAYVPFNRFRPVSKIYTNHLCNSTQLAYNCHTIWPVSPIEFDRFPTPNTSNSFRLCVITQPNNSFAQVTNNTECAQNQTKCGSHPNEFYCSNTKICPITSIGFSIPAPESVEKQDFMWVMRNEEKLPLVEFRVAEGGVCLDNHERAITEGRDDYFLMRVERTGCDRDSRFTLLQSIPEPAYYRANDQMNLPQKLPNYEIDPEYSWGLYNRGYIPWNIQCRGRLMHKFMAAKSDFEDILLCQRNLLIISSVFLGVLSIVMTVFSVGNLIRYDWICIPGAGTSESDIIFGIEVFCKLCLQLVQAYFIWSSWSIVKTQMAFLDTLVLTECSNSFTMSIIIDLKQQLQIKVYRYNVAYLIIFFVTTLIDIIVASAYFRKRVSFYHSLSYTQQNNELEMNNNGSQPYNQNQGNSAPFQQSYVQNMNPDYPMQIPQNNQNPFDRKYDYPQLQQQGYQNPDTNNQSVQPPQLSKW